MEIQKPNITDFTFAQHDHSSAAMGGTISGSTGPTGPQGYTGTQGNTGSQGTQGTQGKTGPQGSTGNQGTTGPQGLKGATGGGGSAAANNTQVVYGTGTGITSSSDFIFYYENTVNPNFSVGDLTSFGNLTSLALSDDQGQIILSCTTSQGTGGLIILNANTIDFVDASSDTLATFNKNTLQLGDINNFYSGTVFSINPSGTEISLYVPNGDINLNAQSYIFSTVSYIFPLTQSTGNGVLNNDGDGNLYWSPNLGMSYSIVVASVNLATQSATSSFLSFTNPDSFNSHTYMISGYINFSESTGYPYNVEVSYIDEFNNPNNMYLLGYSSEEGSTNDTFGSGSNALIPITFLLGPGQTITISTFNGSGGTFDIGAYIMSLDLTGGSLYLGNIKGFNSSDYLTLAFSPTTGIQWTTQWSPTSDF